MSQECSVKLSIIIPVYNAEGFLSKCFSNFERGIEDIEIIIINDGSTDSSSVLCDEFSMGRAFVHVIHQKNSGVSVARNTGIKEAKGEWICFVDSDDYLADNWDEILMTSINEHPDSDVIMFSETLKNKEYKKNDCMQASIGYNKSLGNAGETLCWPVSKVYSKKLIDKYNINFKEGIINGEDMIFNCQVFSLAKKIIGVNKSYYFYYKNMQSATNRFDPRIIETEELFHEELQKIIIDNHLIDKEWKNIYELTLLNGLYAIIYRIGLVEKNVDLSGLIYLLEKDEYRKSLEKLKYFERELSPIKRVVLKRLKNGNSKMAVQIVRILCMVKRVYYKKHNKGIVVKV